MNRLFTFVAAGAMAAGLLAFAGCMSHGQNAVVSNQSNAYAGGNGAFGEDPVNPGEHSRDRFLNAVEAGAQTPAHAQ